MTEYKFTVNGKDFSDLVHKYGYTTDRVPVFSRTVRTMDGVEHMKMIRVRGWLKIKANPLREDRAMEFCEELRRLPGPVEYHSFQDGADVSETMRIAGMPLELALLTPDARFLDGAEITFEQL